jgi:hypothetical protein
MRQAVYMCEPLDACCALLCEGEVEYYIALELFKGPSCAAPTVSFSHYIKLTISTKDVAIS